MSSSRHIITISSVCGKNIISFGLHECLSLEILDSMLPLIRQAIQYKKKQDSKGVVFLCYSHTPHRF